MTSIKKVSISFGVLYLGTSIQTLCTARLHFLITFCILCVLVCLCECCLFWLNCACKLVIICWIVFDMLVDSMLVLLLSLQWFFCKHMSLNLFSNRNIQTYLLGEDNMLVTLEDSSQPIKQMPYMIETLNLRNPRFVCMYTE